MTLALRLVSLIVLGAACAGPLAAGAEPAASGPSMSPLAAQTSAYFDALNTADGRALGNLTTGTFHVVLPDGKPLSLDDFFGRLAAHHLIASTPVATLKIEATSSAETTATETVATSSWDYALNGSPYGPVLERDTATHQLTWNKSSDGTWLLDEDHITSDVHS